MLGAVFLNGLTDGSRARKAAEMLRVLTLSTLFPDASRPQFGIFVERQTAALQQLPDVKLEVVAPIGVPPWPLSRLSRYRRFAGIPEHEAWNGLTVHRPRFRSWPKFGASRAPADMARVLLPLLEAIRARFPFDVIDAEFFWPDGPAARLLADRFGVPYSVKARGSDIHYWGERPDTRKQVRDAGLGAAGLLAVSEALKSDMAALGMPAHNITVHRTGIDKILFRPGRREEARARLGLTGPILATVGALIERKGQSLAIEAAARIDGARLLLIGEGEDRPRLERLIDRLGLGGRVELLGSRPHAEIADYLAAADILVQPSRSEGLANVWVEALASGTPIVTTDAGGARELIDRPEAGMIVDRTPDALAHAITALLADRPDPEAVARTVAEYSWERNAETLHAHLARIADRAPQG